MMMHANVAMIYRERRQTTTDYRKWFICKISGHLFAVIKLIAYSVGHWSNATIDIDNRIWLVWICLGTS